jgi:syntaxin 16
VLLVGHLTGDKMNYAALTFGLCCSRGAVSVGLPPAWVDVSEEISANMQRARTKMTELAKAHAKALMPSFGDGRDDQRAIEVLTHEITDLLKRSEKRLQKLSMKDLSEDSNVRKNVQVMIETCLSVAVTI